jgi:predicted deacylase
MIWVCVGFVDMFPQIDNIFLRQMASGDRLFLQLYKFIGSQPGKKVYIQSNLHGAEISGNGVIHQLIEFLLSVDAADLMGEVWLVPVCNPMGVNERAQHFSPGRHCAYEYKDWNRIFWDYEKHNNNLLAFAKSQIHADLATIRQNYLSIIKQQFARNFEEINSLHSVPYSERFRYQLQAISLDADYLIDLHSSNNQGLDYVYYFRDRHESAKYFLLDFAILLDKYDGDAFDEAFIKPWLALEDCFQQLGRKIKFDIEAWTLELGTGMQMNPDSVAKGLAGVKNYLIQKNLLPNLPSTQAHEMYFAKSSNREKYYAIAGGMIQSRVALGTNVKAGDKLYQILTFNKESQLPTVIDVCAAEDGLVYDVSTNQAVNQGEFVLGLIH